MDGLSLVTTKAGVGKATTTLRRFAKEEKKKCELNELNKSPPIANLSDCATYMNTSRFAGLTYQGGEVLAPLNKTIGLLLLLAGKVSTPLKL